MMNPIFYLVLTILVIAISLYGYWFCSLRRDVRKQWLHLYETLQWRQDILPLLIEIVRKFSSSESVEKLIQRILVARHQAGIEAAPGRKKIELEYDLSQLLKDFFVALEKNPSLHKDVIFLEVKHDLSSLNQQIEAGTQHYNRVVRKYRYAMFGLPKQPIFEFES